MHLCVYLVALLVTVGVVAGLVEAEDGSVCFNNCSGHGKCVDYSCECFVSYFGDDCRYTFADDENGIPILGAGHFNVTAKNYTAAVSKSAGSGLVLMGFSSTTCHKCIRTEPEYARISEELHERKIPFARADTAQLHAFAQDSGVSDLPALVVFRKKRPILYRGTHTKDGVMAFIDKLQSKPTRVLTSVEEVEAFMAARTDRKFSLRTVVVVGFFSTPDSIEEDEFEDFVEAAKTMHPKEDVYIGVVKTRAIVQHFIDAKVIDRSPSMVLAGEAGGDGNGNVDNAEYSTWRAINLDELYGEGLDIAGWIVRNSVPLVGKLVPEVFPLYEKMGLPMLMLFLDLEHEMKSSHPGRLLGGRSGDIINEDLLRELRVAAKEHYTQISFVFLDGNVHKDQMRALGLFGGRERLPSLAFNTKDGRQIPFSEKLPINADTLLQFCADFISGKLQTAADAEEAARKSLLSVNPINPKNKAKRKKRREAPNQVVGVAEQFGDGQAGDDAVVSVDLDNFEAVVMDETKDVLLLLHEEGCEPCAHLSVYFKRMAQRFHDLGIPTLTIARMDVSNTSPPARANLMVSELPILVLLKANTDPMAEGKQAPWSFFSGIGKVRALMDWVQSHAGIPFELPNLPHLNEHQVELYKEQVREREEQIEKKAKEEAAAMEEEDAAKTQAEERRRERTSIEKEVEGLGMDAVEVRLQGQDGFEGEDEDEGADAFEEL